MTPLSYRDLKIRRRRQQLERQKNSRFKMQNNNFARASRFLPSLHDFDVKMLFSFFFWNGFWFFGIQLQESSPTFDKVIEWE